MACGVIVLAADFFYPDKCLNDRGQHGASEAAPMNYSADSPAGVLQVKQCNSVLVREGRYLVTRSFH